LMIALYRVFFFAKSQESCKFFAKKYHRNDFYYKNKWRWQLISLLSFCFMFLLKRAGVSSACPF